MFQENREQFEPSKEELGIAPTEETQDLETRIGEPRIERLIEPESPYDRKLKKEREKEFKKSKAVASEFLRKEREGEDTGSNMDENAGKLDNNVRELVGCLNDLPFLYMTGSCGGHVVNKEYFLKKYGNEIPRGVRVPPEGFAMYVNGHVNFRIDGSPRSLEFIKKLSEVIKRFEEAELHEPDPDYPNNLIGSVQFGKITGRTKIDINSVKELEAKREALKLEIIKLAREFL